MSTSSSDSFRERNDTTPRITRFSVVAPIPPVHSGVLSAVFSHGLQQGWIGGELLRFPRRKFRAMTMDRTASFFLSRWARRAGSRPAGDLVRSRRGWLPAIAKAPARTLSLMLPQAIHASPSEYAIVSRGQLPLQLADPTARTMGSP